MTPPPRTLPRYCAVLAAIALMVVGSADAWMTAVPTTVTSVARGSRKKSETILNAWSLPNPSATSSNPFGAFKPTWYDDHHPTARKVIYNDDDQSEPFHFSLPLRMNDWEGTTPVQESEVDDSVGPRRRFRRAANWAVARLRRMTE